MMERSFICLQWYFYKKKTKFKKDYYVKSVQIRSDFWSVFPVFGLNTEIYGPEITPYLDIFHAVDVLTTTWKG